VYVGGEQAGTAKLSRNVNLEVVERAAAVRKACPYVRTSCIGLILLSMA
jgi:hypothetical protein